MTPTELMIQKAQDASQRERERRMGRTIDPSEAKRLVWRNVRHLDREIKVSVGEPTDKLFETVTIFPETGLARCSCHDYRYSPYRYDTYKIGTGNPPCAHLLLIDNAKALITKEAA